MKLNVKYSNHAKMYERTQQTFIHEFHDASLFKNISITHDLASITLIMSYKITVHTSLCDVTLSSHNQLFTKRKIHTIFL